MTHECGLEWACVLACVVVKHSLLQIREIALITANQRFKSLMTNKIRIGPAGWSYKDWEGIVYPQKPGAKFDPLEYLARFFNTIEINSSFYRPFTATTAKSWAQTRSCGTKNSCLQPNCIEFLLTNAEKRPRRTRKRCAKAWMSWQAQENLARCCCSFPGHSKTLMRIGFIWRSCSIVSRIIRWCLRSDTRHGTRRRFMNGWKKQAWEFATSTNRFSRSRSNQRR